MLISDFDFDLPDDLIAQQPLAVREESRMLVLDRRAGALKDDQFPKFPELLSAGDVVVLNNTKVFPARLLGTSETGARVEVFLVEETGPMVWLTLARPARRLNAGKKIIFSDNLTGSVVEKAADGKVVVEFTAAGSFDDILQEIGRTPLPPYIRRDETAIDSDRERYQTVYASKQGAIAAPTAGLHFTPHILDQVRRAGAELAEITLHVGYGTFEPVRVTDLSQHRVTSERYEITSETAALLNAAKDEGRRVVAIGTTTTRALEHCIAKYGEFAAGPGTADLTITPGYVFRAIDALLTNFHLPQSSLLVLVASFAGYEFTMEAYRHAVTSRYRFYSYGDCMFIA